MARTVRPRSKKSKKHMVSAWQLVVAIAIKKFKATSHRPGDFVNHTLVICYIAMEAMAHLWMIFPAIETSIYFGDFPWRTVK